MFEETLLPKRDSMRKFNKNAQNHLSLEKWSKIGMGSEHRPIGVAAMASSC